jgi:SAM-dependent methyltransferase
MLSSMQTPDAAFKDHFSGVAESYARYRPHYPAALFSYLATLTSHRTCAWDCATGSGQAAIGLAPYFERVVATDASADQIAHAEPAPNLVYRVASAEQSGLDDASVDMVTVAQAAHWFDFERFYAEVRRVLRPHGVLVLWTYAHARIDAGIDDALADFYAQVAPYWPPERRWVDEGYATLPFPLDEVPVEQDFIMLADWTREQYMGYLRTWSSLKEFQKQHGVSPVDEAIRHVAPLWAEDEARRVQWPLCLRVGRV